MRGKIHRNYIIMGMDMEKWALVFPGQGSQFVGMGEDLFASYPLFREIFSRAREVTGVDIARLCREGPVAELDATVNTQLAVLTFELAAYEVFRAHIPAEPAAAAGHSLGEYSALYASGSLTLEEAVLIVQARAKRHQEALPPGIGAMAALLGPNGAEAAEICRACSLPDEPLDLANLNAPNQIVISGDARAIARVEAQGGGKRVKKFVSLPISVPCHSRLLTAAAEHFRADLEKVSFHPSRIPVLPNYDPARLHTPETSRELLRLQMISPVRWQETVERMLAMGITTFVEIGPRRVLSGLIKNIDRRPRLVYIGDKESLDRAVSAWD